MKTAESAVPKTAAVFVDVKALTPWAKNPRKNDPAVKAVADSIKRFGFGAPLLARQANGEIIAGHTRLKAAIKLGLTEVPVRYLDLTESEAHALALADNKVGELAEWDDAVLAEVLKGMAEAGDNIEGLGWSSNDIQKMITEPGTEDGEVMEPPAEPITKAGDLWTLGDHRLLCGDSTKAKDVERLMAGAKADLCFTSPPYALGKSVALSGNKAMAAKANPYGDHEDNADEWDQLMRGWFSASDAAVSNAWVVNVQPLAGNKRDLVRFIADNAARLVDVATWDKGHAQPPMAAGVMASRYEWIIIFASNEGASRAIPLSSWRGTVQSVYAGPPQRSNEFSRVHAATMPLHVPAWVMQTLCDQSKTVYEPFCGTGTTLIAAEQLGRKCYGMELSPAYCDVIINRWETLTGKKATLDV
jgi:hypothetical protein